MTTHSSVLAWRIPGMEEPGRLQFMGSLSRTRLSDFTFTFHFSALEKAMATHSSVLAWRIPGTGEPCGLPSMGLCRVGHNSSDLAAAAVRKGVRQGCILSPCLFNLYAEYIMRNTGLEEAQAGIKIAWRNINNLRYADDTTLMAESEEELEPLDESERGERKL